MNLCDLSLTVGAVQQDVNNKVLSVAAVDDSENPDWLIMTPSHVVQTAIKQAKPAQSAAQHTRPQVMPARTANVGPESQSKQSGRRVL